MCQAASVLLFTLLATVWNQSYLVTAAPSQQNQALSHQAEGEQPGLHWLRSRRDVWGRAAIPYSGGVEELENGQSAPQDVYQPSGLVAKGNEQSYAQNIDVGQSNSNQYAVPNVLKGAGQSYTEGLSKSSYDSNQFSRKLGNIIKKIKNKKTKKKKMRKKSSTPPPYTNYLEPENNDGVKANENTYLHAGTHESNADTSYNAKDNVYDPKPELDEGIKLTLEDSLSDNDQKQSYPSENNYNTDDAQTYGNTNADAAGTYESNADNSNAGPSDNAYDSIPELDEGMKLALEDSLSDNGQKQSYPSENIYITDDAQTYGNTNADTAATYESNTDNSNAGPSDNAYDSIPELGEGMKLLYDDTVNDHDQISTIVYNSVEINGYDNSYIPPPENMVNDGSIIPMDDTPYISELIGTETSPCSESIPHGSQDNTYSPSNGLDDDKNGPLETSDVYHSPSSNYEDDFVDNNEHPDPYHSDKDPIDPSKQTDEGLYSEPPSDPESDPYNNVYQESSLSISGVYELDKYANAAEDIVYNNEISNDEDILPMLAEHAVDDYVETLGKLATPDSYPGGESVPEGNSDSYGENLYPSGYDNSENPESISSESNAFPDEITNINNIDDNASPCSNGAPSNAPDTSDSYESNKLNNDLSDPTLNYFCANADVQDLLNNYPSQDSYVKVDDPASDGNSKYTAPEDTYSNQNLEEAQRYPGKKDDYSSENSQDDMEKEPIYPAKEELYPEHVTSADTLETYSLGYSTEDSPEGTEKYPDSKDHYPYHYDPKKPESEDYNGEEGTTEGYSSESPSNYAQYDSYSDADTPEQTLDINSKYTPTTGDSDDTQTYNDPKLSDSNTVANENANDYIPDDSSGDNSYPNWEDLHSPDLNDSPLTNPDDLYSDSNHMQSTEIGNDLEKSSYYSIYDKIPVLVSTPLPDFSLSFAPSFNLYPSPEPILPSPLYSVHEGLFSQNTYLPYPIVTYLSSYPQGQT